MMKNEKSESLRASELNHLSRIFFERMAQEKWRRVRASNSFQFSAQYTAIVFNILKNNEFEKSRKVLAAKRKSVVQEHGKGNKPQAAQAIDNLRSGSIFVSL